MTFWFSCIFYLYLLQQGFCVHPFHKRLTSLVALNTPQREKSHHGQNKEPFFLSESSRLKNHLEDAINFKKLHNANLLIPLSTLTKSEKLDVSSPAQKKTFSNNGKEYLQQLSESSLNSNKAYKNEEETHRLQRKQKQEKQNQEPQNEEARNEEDKEEQNHIKQSEKLEEKKKKVDSNVVAEHEKQMSTGNPKKSQDSEESMQESITNRSLKLANQAECLNNNIKSLEEELKNINEHNSKKDKEDETKKSLEEGKLEVKRIRNKLMESKNAEENAEELENNNISKLDVEVKEADDEMSKRKENHNNEMKEKEAELTNKEKKLDCETNEALRELSLEDALPQEGTEENFEERRDNLKKKEAAATSEGDLANIQAEALVEYTLEIEKLIKKTESVLNNAEKDYIALTKTIEKNSILNTTDISCDSVKNFEEKFEDIRIQENLLNDAVSSAKETLKKMDKLQDESKTLRSNAETVMKNAKSISCADTDRQFEDVKQETASTGDKIKEFSREIVGLQTRLTDLEGKIETSESTDELAHEEVAKIKEKCQSEKVKSKSCSSDSCPSTKKINETSDLTEGENVLVYAICKLKVENKPRLKKIVKYHREMLN
ncbi:myosin-2 heavy chain-like isoform X2 [Hylaeus volcanicus]|uniref:myosin-2 heavy chain-like isoform X2 n=1 Tax=Hylaeus volcanicus TaxID=313075 RepID=UPI0023B87C79|nr:myosin-2 heavy chain-like isoform X2 [Hylaeus volcanicus]